MASSPPSSLAVRRSAHCGWLGLFRCRPQTGAPRPDLLPDQPEHVLLIHALGVPEACERVAPATLPVRIHRAGKAPPVAEDAAVPRAALHHAAIEVCGELDQAVVGELAQLRAELRIRI